MRLESGDAFSLTADAFTLTVDAFSFIDHGAHGRL
jgi:hypothetical protein